MKCNFNANNNMSFGRITAAGGGKQVLQDTLNKRQKLELKRLLKSQENNPINISLGIDHKNRLCGWIRFNEDSNNRFHIKDYKQRIMFDSPLKFIERLCKKADKLHDKYRGDIVDEKSDFELVVTDDGRYVKCRYED